MRSTLLLKLRENKMLIREIENFKGEAELPTTCFPKSRKKNTISKNMPQNKNKNKRRTPHFRISNRRTLPKRIARRKN